jgi:ATP-binding cassette subfamily C (CFTR/MRP) protein 1
MIFNALFLTMRIQDLLICIAQTGLMASASAWIAISYPFLLAVVYFVLRYYLRTSRQLRHLDLEEKAPIYAQFLETLEGLTSIRAFAWTSPSLSKNHELVDRSQRPFYLMGMIQKWLALILDLIVMVLAVLIVGIAVRLRHTVSPGFTGVALTQIISFTTYLTTMILFWAQMETSISAVARIRAFSTETEQEKQSEPSSSNTSEMQAGWPAAGRVEIKDLSANYG